MVLLDDDVYKETKEIVLGKRKKSPLLIELSDWFRLRYSVLKNLFVIYNDFSDEAKVGANWKATEEVKTQIKSKYPVVWDVISMFSRSVAFYYSDADITLNENNGISKAITNIYYSILKKYDDVIILPERI